MVTGGFQASVTMYMFSKNRAAVYGDEKREEDKNDWIQSLSNYKGAYRASQKAIFSSSLSGGALVSI